MASTLAKFESSDAASMPSSAWQMAIPRREIRDVIKAWCLKVLESRSFHSRSARGDNCSLSGEPHGIRPFAESAPMRENRILRMTQCRHYRLPGVFPTQAGKGLESCERASPVACPTDQSSQTPPLLCNSDGDLPLRSHAAVTRSDEVVTSTDPCRRWRPGDRGSLSPSLESGRS